MILNVASDLSGADPNNIVQFTPIAERAEKMQYGGEFPINDTLLVYSGDQLRDGLSCEQVIQDCLSRAQKAYEEIPGAPRSARSGIGYRCATRSRRWFTGTLRSTTGSSHVLWRHSPARC